MSNTQDYDWTAERVGTLMDLVQAGMSCRLIAFEMGQGLTKGAVQGKISRVRRGKQQTVIFPVHPIVAAARQHLVDTFSAKPFDHQRFLLANAELAQAFEKYMPERRSK